MLSKFCQTYVHRLHIYAPPLITAPPLPPAVRFVHAQRHREVGPHAQGRAAAPPVPSMEQAARRFAVRGPPLLDVPQRGSGAPLLRVLGHGVLGDGVAAVAGVRRRR